MTVTIATADKQLKLCRLCAESKDDLIGIYENEGQKLSIETKISKCLRIQVVVSDCLPHDICIDCYIQLNQSNDFYEKSNQAQCSLQRMLNTKDKNEQESVQNDLASATESKKESIEEKVNCCKEKNLIDSSNENIDGYFDSTNDSIEKNQLDKDKKGNKDKNIVKQNSPKQNNKKKVKRKNITLQRNKVKLQDNLSDEEYNIKEGRKSNVKIPDNYMTGTDSDVEIIVRSERKDNMDPNAKSDRKKGERVERYPWLCTDCNDKLPSLEALEKHHEIIHNQKSKYMCVQCCKVYGKYHGFLTHVKRHIIKTKFSCDECGKTFDHKKVLDSHKAIHSEERPYICQTCGKSFKQQSALYVHHRCHLPENMKNRYTCDQCEKRFSTKPNLVTHQRIHSGIKNFTCDQCGKSFIQKGNLEAHFLTHSADKPYSCSQCFKGFKTPLQLKKHETVHTGAKPHQCNICGRTFRERGTLREHHRIHSGAMPYTCEFCGKSFRFKGILTTHRRQHTGERPYSCLECEHHFTNWPNYNKHMKRRHGINTSRNKRGQTNQQQRQENKQNSQNSKQKKTALRKQQPQISQIEASNIVNAPLSLPPENGSTTTVQVVQAVPQVTVTSQPIVLQALPASAAVAAIQSFIEASTDLPAGSSTSIALIHQQSAERNGSSGCATGQSITPASIFFNALPTQLATFVPQNNLPFNFYNMASDGEVDPLENR